MAYLFYMYIIFRSETGATPPTPDPEAWEFSTSLIGSTLGNHGSALLGAMDAAFGAYRKNERPKL